MIGVRTHADSAVEIAAATGGAPYPSGWPPKNRSALISFTSSQARVALEPNGGCGRAAGRLAASLPVEVALEDGRNGLVGWVEQRSALARGLPSTQRLSALPPGRLRFPKRRWISIASS